MTTGRNSRRDFSLDPQNGRLISIAAKGLTQHAATLHLNVLRHR